MLIWRGKDTTNTIALSSSSIFTFELSRSIIIELESFRCLWTWVPIAILKVYNLSFNQISLARLFVIYSSSNRTQRPAAVVLSSTSRKIWGAKHNYMAESAFSSSSSHSSSVKEPHFFFFCSAHCSSVIVLGSVWGPERTFHNPCWMRTALICTFQSLKLISPSNF